VTKKKDGPAKRKRQRPPADLGFKIAAEIGADRFMALAMEDQSWEALDLLERALVTNLWHRPGKAHHGSIALYSALLERDGWDTEPAIRKTMEVFSVKRSTAFSARKHVLPAINRLLAYMDAAKVRKTLQAFDQLCQSGSDDDDARFRKSMRARNRSWKSK
jgi:hypothetical protein